MDDQAGHGVEHRSDLVQGGASPPTITVRVPFSAPTVPPDSGPSRYRAPVAAHLLVLGPLHVGVDGGAVDDHRARRRAAGTRPSTTSTTSGELGTQSDDHLAGGGQRRLRVPASVAPRASGASTGPRLREHHGDLVAGPQQVGRVMGSPMAPRPTKPTFIAALLRHGLVMRNWGSHRAVAASSSSAMASVARRSPRPARGSRAKAWRAIRRSPVTAASTVSSWTATWRRIHSVMAAGACGRVAARMPSPSTTQMASTTASVGRSGHWPRLGRLTGSSRWVPVSK